MSGPDPALSAVARAIHDADCGCASIDNEHDMTQYPESYFDLAGAALAAARPLIEAEAQERYIVCRRCGLKPTWLECDNSRCSIKVHPYCKCDHDDGDGHWCDEGCPPSAEDLKEHEAEVREAVAREIEARSEELIAGVATDAWEHGYESALWDAARIARNGCAG